MYVSYVTPYVAQPEPRDGNVVSLELFIDLFELAQDEKRKGAEEAGENLTVEIVDFPGEIEQE